MEITALADRQVARHVRALQTCRTSVHLGDTVCSVERLQVAPNSRRRHAQGLSKLRHGNRAGLLHHRHDLVEPIFRKHRLLLLGVHDSPIGAELGHQLHNIGSIAQKLALRIIAGNGLLQVGHLVA